MKSIFGLSVFLVALGPLLAVAEDAGSPPTSGGQGAISQPNNSRTAGPFSIEYTFDYARTLVAKADGDCEPGYNGEVFEGHFNEQGDVSRNAIRWLAHVDAPGHIHWAVRAADDTAGYPTDLTCRQNTIYCLILAAPNRALIGKFDAESLAPTKVVQSSVEPALNNALFELYREPQLPVIVSIIQDGGDHVAFSVLSPDLEIAFSKSYLLPPTVATRSKDPSHRLSRCRMFRAQDGSGYYLVITDVTRDLDGQPGEVTRMGIIRTGLDGALKWSRLYTYDASGFGPLTVKIASDSAILGYAAYASKSGNSLMVKIEPDGRQGWAKIFDVPNMVLNDFHCDGTPYRFINPSFKAMGVTVARGLPQTLLFALDYGTGRILYQTRFPGSFTGAPGLSAQKEDSLYVSTLGMQFAKGAMKGVASISRFNQQLEFVNAKEIIGAEASFPLLTCGTQGVNFLSYEFSKPFRGVGSAVNDNLEPVDVACPWTKPLKLAMEPCTYSGRDVQSKEESFEITPGDGTAAIKSASFNLCPLPMKLHNVGESTGAAALAAQNSLPSQQETSIPQPETQAGQRYSFKALQKRYPQALGDPQSVAYRATNETGTQSTGSQVSPNATEPENDNIEEDARYAPMDARLNRVYSALRSTLSRTQKEDLKRLEKEFLDRREGLKGNPDAFFALTEKQIGILERMISGGVGAGKSTANKVVAASPDGKYQLVRGNELIIGGTGTTPATLQSNLTGDADRPTGSILWSPGGDKVLVLTPGDEGTNGLQVAWLRGPNWQSDFCPETSDVPHHYLGDNFKVLGWLSDDTFEVTNAIILNSREPLPAVRYKVKITAKGPAIIN